MGSLRRRCFAAGDAGKFTHKRQVLHPPVRVRFELGARYAAWDAGDGHRSELLQAPFVFGRAMMSIAESAFSTLRIWRLGHGVIARLVRSAAFNANFPCGTDISYVARIFSITRSIK